MVVKLLSDQIPVFWDTIKFCVSMADEVEEKNLQSYFTDLLYKLMSEKAQCFVRLSEDRVLLSMLITKVDYDKSINKRILHIQCLYSFSKFSDSDWRDDFKIIRNFAKSLDCSVITFDTRNKRIMDLGDLIGFRETHRSFALELEV